MSAFTVVRSLSRPKSMKKCFQAQAYLGISGLQYFWKVVGIFKSIIYISIFCRLFCFNFCAFSTEVVEDYTSTNVEASPTNIILVKLKPQRSNKKTPSAGISKHLFVHSCFTTWAASPISNVMNHGQTTCCRSVSITKDFRIIVA